MPVRLLLQSLYKSVREKLITLNVYDSRTSDPLIIRREILSTRLYIILVIISLIILTTYTSLINQIENKTVAFPTQSVYENLRKKYADNLQCTCSKVSIPYEKFVKIVPSFHQVCSSDFISQQWIDFVFKADSTLIMPIDVRTSLSTMWQLIRAFCQSATDTVLNAINQFNNSLLINSMLLNEDLLEAKVQAALHLLLQTASSNCIQSRTIVQRMTQANQLVTALLTNYIVVTDKFGLSQEKPGHIGTPTMNVSTYIGILGNKYIPKNSTVACSCKNNGSCPLPGNLYLYNASEKFGIYDMNKIEVNESLSGIIIDCLPIQMTLSSSLECFYNQSCLNILLSSYSTKINISILNQSIPTRFNSTTKLESHINELFIEEILNETSYTEYYSQCLPNSCHYTYPSRFNSVYVLTTLIGLFGGITTILRIITPLIIQLFFFLKKRFFSKQLQQIEQSPNETIRIRLIKFFREIEGKIIQFSLYDQHSRDPIRACHGRLATLLYFTLVFISLCPLILLSDFSNQTINEIISDPSIEKYQELEKKYSSTLICPCTHISIPYEDFLKIEVKYHQICSSDFIQPWWYERFLSLNTSDRKFDFSTFAPSYFQTLSAFCDIAKITINDAIQRFSATNFVNSQLLSHNSFILRVNSLNNTFAQLTRTEFLYRMNLTNILLHSNQYISNMQANTYLDIVLYLSEIHEPTSVSFIVKPQFGFNTNRDACLCVLDSTCILDLQISQDHQTFQHDSQLEVRGCSIINSVLKSSMICWFKNTCLLQLRTLFNNSGVSIPLSITPLNASLSSRYFPNTSIETIFNEMMIEEWNFSYSFEKFYHKCKPSYCSFTYEKEINIVYIITIIISLIGGINTTLELISPLIIKIVFKFIGILKHCRPSQIPTTQQENHQNDGICNVISNLIKRLKDAFLMMNLFDSESNDAETSRRERISSRLYLVFLSISMCVITMYTVVSSIAEHKSILNPSENEYNNLSMSYSKSLDCPCKKISIEYKYFLNIDTRSHSICSSDFISVKWQNYMLHDKYWIDYDRRDIRGRGAAYFSFLSNLCQISQTTINNSIDQFLNDIFINTQLLTKSEFRIQIDNIILQFRNVTLENFSRSLKLLRDIINGNAFVSSYFLNWYLWQEPKSTFATVPTRPILMKDGCSCATRNDCNDSGGFYQSGNRQIFAMPGWNVGCSVVETVLSSTFECLYNQTCIDLLLLHIHPNFIPPASYRRNMPAINFSNENHFKRNTLIQNIADELFVEEWKNNSFYSSFYNQCAPIYCSYKTKKDDYVIYTISKVLGLYGGLTFALRFTIPLVVKIIFQIRNKCRRNTVTPNG